MKGLDRKRLFARMCPDEMKRRKPAWQGKSPAFSMSMREAVLVYLLTIRRWATSSQNLAGLYAVSLHAGSTRPMFAAWSENGTDGWITPTSCGASPTAQPTPVPREPSADRGRRE
jgi:hypothetical protein